MKIFRSIYLLFMLMAVLSSCEKENHEHEFPSVAVTTVTVQPQTVPASYEFVGVAESSHLVEIRARVDGYLDKVAYQEGQLVHENDLLFQIDPKPFVAALDQAKAAEEQQEAVLWEAQRTVERLKPLYEQKAASRRDLDTALAQEQGAKAAVAGAKAQIIQAELNLGYTTIRTPITGLSGQSIFRQGALVGPGEKSLLTTVSALDPIWVNFNVSEGDILKMDQGVREGRIKLPKDMQFEIEVVFSDGSKLPNKGRVDFADPTFQTGTGSMHVRAVLPNPEQLLRPGQFVRAHVSGAVYPNAIIVPQRSVMQGNNGLYVYVVTNEDKVEMRPIDAGSWYKEDWIIKSGLQPGERVIVDGVNKVMPGSIVKVEELAGTHS